MNMPRLPLPPRLDRHKLVEGVTVVAAGAALCVAAYAVWRFNKILPIEHLIAGPRGDA